MKSIFHKIILFVLALSTAVPASAQFTASGTEPAKIKWQTFNSANYQLIYPEGLDSLARLYAKSLERFRIPNSVSSGFKANEYLVVHIRKKMALLLLLIVLIVNIHSLNVL